MTQPPEPDTIDLAIVSCEACDQLFLFSPRRGTCPTCGGAPGLYFFEFVAGPAGLSLKAPLGPATISQAPLEPPFSEPAAEPVSSSEAGLALPVSEETLPPTPGLATPLPEPSTPAEDIPLAPIDLALSCACLYLEGDSFSDDELRQALLDAGVELEDAYATVGRLTAIRDLFTRLASPPTEEPHA